MRAKCSRGSTAATPKAQQQQQRLPARLPSRTQHKINNPTHWHIQHRSNTCSSSSNSKSSNSNTSNSNSNAPLSTVKWQCIKIVNLNSKQKPQTDDAPRWIEPGAGDGAGAGGGPG